MAQNVDINKLTLNEMMLRYELYHGLVDGLGKLPLPYDLSIEKGKYKIPQDLNELTGNICYGQRMFLGQKEDDDFGTILRLIVGYYYPIATKEKWDADKALLFEKNTLTCIVIELFPIAIHMATLVKEMADREETLLHREPSKIELAAGIEKLNVFSELSSLDFLRDAMKITVPEVLLTPYNECLVRFMMAKELQDFQERYFKLQMELSKKVKNKGYDKS